MTKKHNKMQQYKSVEEYEKEFCFKGINKNWFEKNDDYSLAQKLAKQSLEKYKHLLVQE